MQSEDGQDETKIRRSTRLEKNHQEPDIQENLYVAGLSRRGGIDSV
jgi:hypothetical protein